MHTVTTLASFARQWPLIGLKAWLCVLLLSFTAHGSDTPEQHTQPTVAFLEIVPFYYTNEDGQPAGLSYDIAELVFGALDQPYKSVTMPPPRVFHALSNGHHDFTLSYKMPKLFPRLTFFGLLGCQQIVLTPLKGSGIKTLADIKGKRIAYLQGGRFDRLYSSTGLFEGRTAVHTINMFKLAARRRVDAIVANKMHMAGHRNIDPEKIGLPSNFWNTLDTPIFITSIEASFAISNPSKFQHLIPSIESVIQTVRRDGTLEKLFKKYGEPTGGSCDAMPETPESLLSKEQSFAQ